MVSETITAPAYNEHFQELVDWVEEHKTERYVEVACIGLGSPTMTVTSSASFATDGLRLRPRHANKRVDEEVVLWVHADRRTTRG
jgi:hypothetical protein